MVLTSKAALFASRKAVESSPSELALSSGGDSGGCRIFHVKVCIAFVHARSGTRTRSANKIVNFVHPGPTDMNAGDGPTADFLRSQIELGRFGQVENVAAAVAF